MFPFKSSSWSVLHVAYSNFNQSNQKKIAIQKSNAGTCLMYYYRYSFLFRVVIRCTDRDCNDFLNYVVHCKNQKIIPKIIFGNMVKTNAVGWWIKCYCAGFKKYSIWIWTFTIESQIELGIIKSIIILWNEWIYKWHFHTPNSTIFVCWYNRMYKTGARLSPSQAENIHFWNMTRSIC